MKSADAIISHYIYNVCVCGPGRCDKIVVVVETVAVPIAFVVWLAVT